ncbi:MAG: glycosyltransferase family 2 protein [Candidatus Daviesbacteria bacterium]|nr:glycosyltransferase family 2 protein [Candidatus Daviesbacteria bacterium]
MKKISVVIPTFNESKNIPTLVPAIVKNIPKKYDYEIIFVDDNSPDGTFEVIRKIGQTNKRVKGICMYRRFGLQPSFLAGIKRASGDAIVTMDADFQHPPEMLPQMIALWEKGYDLVQPQKQEDKSFNPLLRSMRQFAYHAWENISDGTLIPGVSDFRLMDHKVAEFIISSGETETFLRGLVNMGANNPLLIPYKVGKRKFGKSSFNVMQLLNIFIVGFISFSPKPLRLASFFGLLIAVSTSIFLIIDILNAITTGKTIIPGWETIVFLLLTLNGFVIFYLGILGEYIGIIFKEVKRRPPYIVGKEVNLLDQ